MYIVLALIITMSARRNPTTSVSQSDGSLSSGRQRSVVCDTADHVKYVVYAEMTAGCSKPRVSSTVDLTPAISMTRNSTNVVDDGQRSYDSASKRWGRTEVDRDDDLVALASPATLAVSVVNVQHHSDDKNEEERQKGAERHRRSRPPRVIGLKSCSPGV